MGVGRAARLVLARGRSLDLCSGRGLLGVKLPQGSHPDTLPMNEDTVFGSWTSSALPIGFDPALALLLLLLEPPVSSVTS